MASGVALGPVQVEQAGASSDSPLEPARRFARILIVEDDPLFRRFCRAALQGNQRARIEADLAGSWTEAHQLLRASAYDCLVLDMGLPDSQGIATVQAALQAAPTTPIVVLSGEEDARVTQRALAEGVQDFIEKSQADPATLERAIRHAVDRSHWTRELAAKNRELQTRNAELDDFAHIISHDLKAPLRAIYYVVSEAQEHLAAADVATAQEGLKEIAPRIKRLFGMIDGVLRLSQAGRTLGDPQVVQTATLVADVVDNLVMPPGFTVEVAPGLPAIVAHPTVLTQVFQNLIDNALKHHGGSAGLVEVGWADAGTHWAFTVSDDGPGVPPEMRERVFKLFETLGAPKVPPGAKPGTYGNPGPGTGTGVGLALVRKLVEANGGTIGIEESRKGGACFRFTWPKHVEE